MSELPIFELYKSLNLWNNPICMACRTVEPKLFGPVGIWQLGRDFATDQYKVAFIGKNARGNLHHKADDQLRTSGFIDSTDYADSEIKKRKPAYFYYTASIIENIFGSLENGWERVAFTNLVKCNNSMTTDNTTFATKRNCLDNLEVIWKELEIIKPRNIIFFSNYSYDDFIERYTSRFKVVDVKNKNCFVEVGQKTMLWWERHCTDEDGRKFRILRTSHPERMKKDPYVQKLAQWVKSAEL